MSQSTPIVSAPGSFRFPGSTFPLTSGNATDYSRYAPRVNPSSSSLTKGAAGTYIPELNPPILTGGGPPRSWFGQAWNTISEEHGGPEDM